MSRVTVLFAHPGQRHSQINMDLASVARATEGIEFVDLYSEYPRFKIDIDREQKRLLDHDAIIFQFPVYWYSTPSLLKEWQDLVLEYGFAYGPGGDRLAGKLLLPAATAGGPENAYQQGGYNNFRLRTLFSPLEQTANLCQMRYIPPFVLFASLKAGTDGRAGRHVAQYRVLLESLRDDRFDVAEALKRDLLSDGALPVLQEA